MNIPDDNAVRVAPEGQLVIPKELMEALGFLPYTPVEFERVGNELRVKKSAAERRRNAAEVVKNMTGKGSVQMTTEEIMALMRGD